jgi:flavin reductase (DIM6/NTAB) family NADH-FMN oxidoreductase RutF
MRIATATHLGPPLVDLAVAGGVSGSELRAAIGHFATGVTVITSARGDTHPLGSTANAISSVSLDPPLVLVCLRRESETLAALLQHRRFAVNVLGDGQHGVAQRFAKSSSAAQWEGIHYRRSPDGVPLLTDALATLQCALHDVSDGGDHQIVIGRVLDVEHASDHTRPLLFYRGEFAGLNEPAATSAARDVPLASRRPAHEPMPPDGLPEVFVPTPDGDMQLLAVDQEQHPNTSVIALIGSPRGSSGLPVYLHLGCLLGDALGHLHCSRRLALKGALRHIREQGAGVVVYHRDDSSPFAGCCLQPADAPASAHHEGALQALRQAIGELALGEVRLLSSPTAAPDLVLTEALGLQVASIEHFTLDAPVPAPAC